MGCKQKPVDLESLYRDALDLHQQGQPGEAICLYNTVVNHVPQAAQVHYNLGLAFYETEQYSLAAGAFRQAAELNPGDVDILHNLGLACKKAGRLAEAEEAYLKGLQIDPSDLDLLYNLGCCYRDAGEMGRAGKIFAGIVETTPDHLAALNNLAYLHHLQGDYDQAKNLYGQILRLDPNHVSAEYMHAVLDGRKTDIPPKEYIRALFDQYSDTFEENLINDLGYNLFLELRVAFDAIEKNKRIYDHCLDLGCGTGLAGEAFRTACLKLTGVDLSAKMIAQAEKKKIYDNLHVEEILDFLNTHGQSYDLIIAADVLEYIGDLQPFFHAAAQRSLTDALLCFSTEQAGDEEWTLQPTGRYAHHPDYVMENARAAGWIVLREVETPLRREGDQLITGNIFVMIYNPE
jgi:predicted TPR repeat methyltransferase